MVFGSIWPAAAEIANVEKIVGVALPSLSGLSEIESSSCSRSKDGILYMSTPATARQPEGFEITPPVGFVLSARRLVTVRFMPLPSFDAVAAKFGDADIPKTGLEVFTQICEEAVDRGADVLEHLAVELNKLSTDAFRAEDRKGRHPARANRLLRSQLRQVGRFGDRLSGLRDGLQGLGRVVAYTDQHGNGWSDGALKPRLDSLSRDIHSLIEYEEQLANKVQFVLDALVGLIGIAQNDIFKVLTIVSIVGIPPTLLAGVYGMNFKNMPEYDWTWGYEYGLAAIILSVLIPLGWFKMKGWF